jgi:hypothetical protein
MILLFLAVVERGEEVVLRKFSMPELNCERRRPSGKERSQGDYCLEDDASLYFPKNSLLRGSN